MNKMKYVVVTSEDCGEQLFIFPLDVDHDSFAEILSYIKTGGRNWTRAFRKPISAGFTDGVHCFGYSETLSLGSRECDTDLLYK